MKQDQLTTIEQTLKQIATDVKINQDGIQANQTAIKANQDGIQANQTAIKANQDGIQANQTAINQTARGVADLQETMKQTAKTSDLEKWKDDILTSNDRVAGEIKKVLTEQQAITINYKRVDSRVESLEHFAKQAAAKLDLEFEPGRV